MKNSIFRRPAWFRSGLIIVFLLLATWESFAGAIPNGPVADWNVTVLDQLIAGVPAGQQYARIDDMYVPVTYLQNWRNYLAGGPQPNSAFANGFTAWPAGNVYYAFDASVSPSNQKVFTDCAAEWATFANLHFIARSSQANYILVTNNASLSGGLSVVGMGGGAQLLHIGPTSWNHGTVVHEIGHALGLVHEHQRSDRDNYVTINSNNVAAGQLQNFVLLTTSQNKGPYDFLSVMHYSHNAFSASPSLDTIVPHATNSQYLNIMGQRFDPVLSTNDRVGMISIYGAGSGAASVVTNTLDSGPGSLRAALYYAYDHHGTTITFNIPNTDPGFSNNVFNIHPSDQLTSLVNATILDGTTEPVKSNPSGPQILINGVSTETPSIYANGIQLTGTNCTVRGLVVNNFNEYGFLINGSNNTVAGCYAGVDPTGTLAVTNGICPVHIGSGAIFNVVGGTVASNRNVISGSALQGLTISDAGTSFNVVEGNYIGLNAAGTATLPNTWSGVEIYGGASSNIIGGPVAAARNVISGNAQDGVLVSGSFCNGNVIAGNYLGLNPAGTAALGNGWVGADLYYGATGNVVSNNVIGGNGHDGVLCVGPTTVGNFVAVNYIGLNAAGTSAVANGYAGVDLQAGTLNNVIAGNVISGNINDGIYITGPATAGNNVTGNEIGLNAAGTAALANGFSGVDMQSGTFNNVVASNVISGNLEFGVLFEGSSNSVWGNIIGLNAAGTGALGNGYAGVAFYAASQANTLGGYAAAARNVISGNKNQGVVLDGAPVTQNLIVGNYIGLNAAGTAAISNAWSGVEISGGPVANIIGGTGGGRNFISGNGNYGVDLNNGANANVIQGNTIGLNGTNGAAVPNVYVDVVMFSGAQSNLVGGITAGAANLISASTSDGVQIIDTTTVGNTIRGNSIFNDAGNAIGLYSSGNHSLAAPALSSAVVTTGTTVTGTYNGASGTTFQLDFYSDVTPAASAEGMTYLGSRSVTGTGSAAAFTASLGAPVPTGRAITASATDPAGNTSQLSTGTAVTMTSTPNDGIPDAWRKMYFGGTGTTTNSTSYAGGDPDHDGMSNLQEFLSGTNPTNAASVFGLTAKNPVSTPYAVALNSSNGIVCRVWYRDDLSSGNWNILADQIQGNGSSVLLADPGATATLHRFYRAQILW